MSFTEALMNIDKPIVDDTSLRREGFEQVVKDFELEEDGEFFADPEQRLEFLASLEFEDFIDVTNHINNRLRGLNPRDETFQYSRSKLPMLATPPRPYKKIALKSCIKELQDYLASSNDTVEDKTIAASMAVEAMIIWVHPFDDGNGRTSRFLGRFIREGIQQKEELEESTVFGNKWQSYFAHKVKPELPEAQHHVILPEKFYVDSELTPEEVDPDGILSQDRASQLATVLSMENVEEAADLVFDKYIDWSKITSGMDTVQLSEIVDQVSEEVMNKLVQTKAKYEASLPVANVRYLLDHPEYRVLLLEKQQGFLEYTEKEPEIKRVKRTAA